MERVEPDKIRFVGPKDSSLFIHSIELSDERSIRPFITLWFRGKTRAQVEWCKNHPTGDLIEADRHSPDIFHREKNESYWPEKYFDGAIQMGWNYHIHILLDSHPQLADVTPFFDQTPSEIQDDIKQFFGETK